MWFSNRVTKSLLSSMAHNLSLSKICKRFFSLGGWEQNINGSLWVALPAPVSVVAIHHKWLSPARLLKWCAARRAVLHWAGITRAFISVITLQCLNGVLLTLHTLWLECFWECAFALSGTWTIQELKEIYPLTGQVKFSNRCHLRKRIWKMFPKWQQTAFKGGCKGTTFPLAAK